MSDYGTANVTVRIDSREADREVRDLLRLISRQVAQVRVEADARTIPRTVTSAVDAADTGVEVTADTTGVAPEIEGAVDAADTAVTVTGDARELTGDIDGAVDAADSEVVVTGEATDVTGSINAAVDAADTHVVATADASGLQEAADASDALAFGMGRASTNASLLGAGIAGIGLGTVIVQINAAAQAASALEESTSKAGQVFRENVGVVEDFAETSATSVGLASQAAIEAAGTFGNLFTSMGVGRQAAAGMSTGVIQLGADLASFNNLGVDDTLEKIRSGLVGEIEPLRSLGISFNAAQVEAKGMELGLAGANGELTEGAKVQARWALIQELAANAAGDFARTSEGLANQQRILRAEFQNAVVTVGQAFLPVLLDLVHTARGDLIPAAVDMAEALGPALGDALRAMIPLLGTSTRLVTGFAPVIEALAHALDLIPDPVLQFGAALFVANRAANLSTGPLGRLVGSFGGLGGLLVRGGPVIGGLLLLGTVMDTVLGDADLAAADLGKLTDNLETFGRTGKTSGELARIAGDDWGKLRDSFELLDDPGILDKAEQGVGHFTETVSLGLFDTRSGLDDAQTRIKSFDEALAQVGGTDPAQAFELVTEAARRLGIPVDELIAQLPAYGAAIEASKNQAESAGIAVDDYGVEITGTGAAAAAATGQHQAHAAALEAASTALVTASQAAPGLAAALTALRVPGGNLSSEFAALSTAIARADLSAEEMEAVAGALGVDLDTLSTHVDGIRAVIEGLQSTAVGAVPGIDSISSQVDDLANVTAPQLDQILSDMLTDITAFNANLARVMTERPLLAPIAAQAPEFAALISKMIGDGETAMLDRWELLVAGNQTQAARLPQIVRDLSPGYVAELDRLGVLGTDALSGAYHPEGVTRTRTQAAQVAIAAQKEGISITAEDVGFAGQEGFGRGLSPVPGIARKDFGAARNAIAAEREPHRREGSLTAAASASAYQAALAPIPRDAGSAMESARQSISRSRDGLRRMGRTAGSDTSGGFRTGMSIDRPVSDAIVRKWRKNILEGVQTIFNIDSPARVMIPYGRQVAAGFVEGIVIDKNRMRTVLAQVARTLGMGIADLARGVGGGKLTGLQDTFEGIVRTILRLGGGSVSLISGWRSSSQQAALYARYLAGRGNLAAPPGRSMHERGLAVDWGGNRATYTRLSHMFGLRAPVRGEPWHWQPSWTTSRSFYQRGAWETADELARLHAGEMVLPARIAAAVRSFMTSSQPQPVGTRELIVNVRIGNVYGASRSDMQALGKALSEPIAQKLMARQVRFAARTA